MKLYHVTPVENAKSIITTGTKNNTKHKFNRGAFYFFCSLRHAISHAVAEENEHRGKNLCILQFEMEPDPANFNIDTEASYEFIHAWIRKNSEEISRVTGYKLMEPASKLTDKFSDDREAPRWLYNPDPNRPPSDPRYAARGLVGMSSTYDIKIPPDDPFFSAKKEDAVKDRLYAFISSFPQLEASMEKFAFDHPRVRNGEVRLALAYFGPPVFPEKVLSPEGAEIQLQQEGFASRKIVVERWQRLAGILK